MAQFRGKAEELVDGDEFERPVGQFVVHVFFQPGEAVQFFLAGGEELLLQEFLFDSAEGLDISGELAVPLHEGPFGNVDFGSDMSQAPALGAEFDEFILGLLDMHR